MQVPSPRRIVDDLQAHLRIELCSRSRLNVSVRHPEGMTLVHDDGRRCVDDVAVDRQQRVVIRRQVDAQLVLSGLQFADVMPLAIDPTHLPAVYVEMEMSLTGHMGSGDPLGGEPEVAQRYPQIPSLDRIRDHLEGNAGRFGTAADFPNRVMGSRRDMASDTRSAPLFHTRHAFAIGELFEDCRAVIAGERVIAGPAGSQQ